MKKWYVITAMDDPGSEFESWEEAAAYHNELERKGAEPIIIGPGCDPGCDSNNGPSWAPHW